MTIKGKVVDASTGTALPGATIELSSNGAGTVADNGGNFSLDVPDGSYLTVSFVGYTDRIEPATNFNGTVGLTLESDTSMPEAVVTYIKKAAKGNPWGLIVTVIILFILIKLFRKYAHFSM